jgi:hypothetical protein
MVVFSLLLIAFATKTTALYSRQEILLWMVGSYCLQLLAHLSVPLLLENQRLEKILEEHDIVSAYIAFECLGGDGKNLC